MAKLLATTYEGLNDLLPPTESARKTIGNNTVAQRDGLAINVYLHGSLIVTLTELYIDYSLAGWPTVTTRDRVSQFLRHYGYGVGQRNGQQVLVRLSDHTTAPMDERAFYTLYALHGKSLFTTI